MSINNIDTKELYRSANKLTARAREIYADGEKAHEFMCEGFISEQQCAEIEADREKKMAPYEDGAKLLTSFALAADAQWAKAESQDVAWVYGLGGKDLPIGEFDMDAVNAALRLAAMLGEPTPC